MLPGVPLLRLVRERFRGPVAPRTAVAPDPALDTAPAAPALEVGRAPAQITRAGEVRGVGLV